MQRILLALLIVLPAFAGAQTPYEGMQQLLDRVGIAGEDGDAITPALKGLPLKSTPTPMPEGTSDAAPGEQAEAKPETTPDPAPAEAEPVAKGDPVKARRPLGYGYYRVTLENGVLHVAPLKAAQASGGVVVPSMAAIVALGTPRPPGYGTVIEIEPPATLSLQGSADIFPRPASADKRQQRPVERSKAIMPQYNDGNNPDISQKNRDLKRAINRAEQAVTPINKNLPRNWQNVQ